MAKRMEDGAGGEFGLKASSLVCHPPRTEAAVS